MRHHRHAARHQKGNGLGHYYTPLKFNRSGASLCDDTRSIGKSLSGAFLICAKGHINDHQG